MDDRRLEKLAVNISYLKSIVKCPICLEPSERSVQLECRHRFCSNCISQVTEARPTPCPICKSPIKKRTPFYRDRVADSVGKFVNVACQIIKEKYAHDVDSLSSGKLNLKRIIEVAPPDFIGSDLKSKKVTEACQSTSTKLTTHHNLKELRVVVPFNNEATKHQILDWLDKTSEKFDKLIPTPLGEEAVNFEMPSISQVALAEKKSKGARNRSQSLTVRDSLPEPLVKRYTSLAEGLNSADIDDYSIEEIHSETLVKQVERKVIQNLLEDECLAKLDQVAEEAVKESKRTLAKKRKKSFEENKSPNDSGSSSGWDRIKKVKNCLEKVAKTPKQLKIKLQSGSTNKNLNTKPKVTKRKSDSPKEINVEPCKKTEADLATEKAKTVNYDQNNDDDDDIYLIPTQVTTHSNNLANPSENPVWVQPISNDIKDLDSAAIQLYDQLKLCRSNAGALPEKYSRTFEECFTNLLTYANQIIKLGKEKRSSKCFESLATQTEILRQLDVAIQTENRAVPSEHKNIQTVNSQFRNVLVQTDFLEGLEAKKGKMVSQNKGEETVVCLPKISTRVPDESGEKSSRRKSSSRISSQSKTSESSAPLHISVDESKEKSSKISKISEGSELLITLGSSAKSVRKKINRKLVYEEPKSDRKFKRIRTFSSDSEPEDGLPKKRKLVRDDLTVEFLDTESVMSPKERPATPESEKIDYDQYLLDVMSKYDPGPSTTTKKSSPAKKSCLPEKVKKDPKKKSQISSSLNDDHVFTDCTALDNLDLEFVEQQLPRSLNTESDLVEPTPMVYEKPSKFKLSSKKSSLEAKQPEKILSKGSAPSVILKSPNLAETSGFNKTGTLNRNLALQTQSNGLPNDVADMLKDLENRKDIFDDDFESQAKEIQENGSNKSLCEFEDDQELENEMKKISFTAAEKASNQNKVTIIEDIVLRPERELEIDESDGSDCDIVDSTPQKVKPHFADRSILRDLEVNEQNNVTSQDLDLCLPPPPGFADPDLDVTNLDNHKENQAPAAVTLQRLTDFLVSPEHKTQSERLVSQTNTPVLSALKTRAKQVETPRTTEIIIEDTEEVFSPIAKSSMRQSQCKFTPLLSVSRSAKKTTMLTSTPTQKSILNFVVPSQHSTASKKPCIMWSRIINKDLNIFTQLECKKLLTTAKLFNHQVTHLVVLVDERGRIVSHTAKTLQAIAAGIWVVRYEWVEDCLRMNRIVSEEPYEVLDSTGQPGPQTARLNHKSSPLFKGFWFLCAPPLKSVPKFDLENIIGLAGGDITNDISDFLLHDGKTNVIITESEFTEDIDQFEGYLDNFKTVTVDVEWLSSCIGQYKIVSFRPYLVTGDETAIGDLGYPPVLIESVPFTLTETNN